MGEYPGSFGWARCIQKDSEGHGKVRVREENMTTEAEGREGLREREMLTMAGGYGSSQMLCYRL